ncbi:MAG: hypothetical protein KF724_00870 [Phycisphaeraceae bacterium]|nr:hypothetical protein [Phycisphaeraceae bacterium]
MSLLSWPAIVLRLLHHLARRSRPNHALAVVAACCIIAPPKIASGHGECTDLRPEMPNASTSFRFTAEFEMVVERAAHEPLREVTRVKGVFVAGAWAFDITRQPMDEGETTSAPASRERVVYDGTRGWICTEGQPLMVAPSRSTVLPVLLWYLPMLLQIGDRIDGEPDARGTLWSSLSGDPSITRTETDDGWLVSASWLREGVEFDRFTYRFESNPIPHLREHTVTVQRPGSEGRPAFRSLTVIRTRGALDAGPLRFPKAIEQRVDTTMGEATSVMTVTGTMLTAAPMDAIEARSVIVEATQPETGRVVIDIARKLTYQCGDRRFTLDGVRRIAPAPFRTLPSDAELAELRTAPVAGAPDEGAGRSAP